MAFTKALYATFDEGAFDEKTIHGSSDHWYGCLRQSGVRLY
jgi:hypothetical protein